jgi:hypothetical protein
LGKFWKVLQWKMFGIFRAILFISRPTGIFYGHFWYTLWSLGIFLPVLVYCTEKNLATLVHSLGNSNFKAHYVHVPTLSE